ncbi:DNase I-like protein [Fistulina hepatica ATCC 64428]|uniref:DNase I-like protein n=1 Tax=Fistulina hepatica ATCC 64428 TaxID=1128425 RepID=A0A0D7AJJ0_9AGAR|nr:DNase I-like protein [Fistulina hepatica ATCC 64428]
MAAMEDRTQAEPQNRNRNRKRKSKVTVKVASWNMRGRGLIAPQGENMTTENKWLHINQLIKNRKIGALAVQETHLTDKHTEELHEIFGKRLQIIHSSNPVDADHAERKVLIPGRAMVVSLPWNEERKLNVLVVYAPNLNKYSDTGENLNALFWTKIIAKLEEMQNQLTIDVMLGDTNMVEDQIDRLPMHADNIAAADALDDLKLIYGLSDGWRQANPMKRAYTYHQKATGSKSRLDRIYTTKEVQQDCIKWSIKQPGIETDHKIITATIVNTNMPFIGQGRWTFPTHMLDNKKLKGKIRTLGLALQGELNGSVYPQGWQGPQESPQRRYAHFKQDLRETTRNFCKITIPIIQMQINDLENDIQQTLNDPDVGENEKIENAAILEERLASLERAKHTRARRYTTATNRLRGKTATDKYWAKSNKEIRTRDIMKVLSVPDSTPPKLTTDTTEMAEIAKDYHEKLQTIDVTEGGEPQREEAIDQALAEVPQEARYSVYTQFSYELT